jgi:hypothetical protein
MEGFSTLGFTRRTASAARQAPTHRPVEPLFQRLWELWSSSHTPQPHQGCTQQEHWISPKFPPSGLHDFCWAHTPQACQASNPQLHTHDLCQMAGLPSQRSTGMQDLCWTVPVRLPRPVLHRPAGSPLCQAWNPQVCQAHDPKAH